MEEKKKLRIGFLNKILKANNKMKKWCWLWCFWTVVLEKTLEHPLDCREIQLVNPKGNQSWIFIARTDAEAPVLWPSYAKNWLIWKDPDAWMEGGEGCNRGWDSWMASPTQWTWVWVASGVCDGTGKPGMLQSMGSQRAGHDWATELKQHCSLGTIPWWLNWYRICLQCRRPGFDPWDGKIPWRREQLSTLVF